MTTREVLQDVRGYKWPLIVEKAKENAEVIEEFGEVRREGSVFLGTVFALAPSGKYYTPWATSNVEACSRCGGKGKTKNGKECSWCAGIGSREAYLDEIWQEAMGEAAAVVGLYLTGGEGDPCDIFAVYSEEVA